MKVDMTIWEKLGPYSTQLDIDESENIDKTWAEIAKLLDLPLDYIKSSIEPLRDVFIMLDHTRSVMFLIRDGSLPSNVGGGFNLRNILRRTFSIMDKNKWWDKMTFEDYLEIFKY